MPPGAVVAPAGSTMTVAGRDIAGSTGAASVGLITTASVGLTGADLCVVHDDRISVGYGQFDGGSAAPRTCSAISTAPHIMTEATSVDSYADAMAQEVPSLIGRTGTASVFAAFVEIDITCLALASLTGSALPDSVVLFTDLALAPLPDLPP